MSQSETIISWSWNLGMQFKYDFKNHGCYFSVRLNLNIFYCNKSF